MTNRAATIARRILKRAYGGPVLLFRHDGSFASLLAGGETVQAGGDLVGTVDRIYGDHLPDAITLRAGTEPEHPGQKRLFDTGEDDERFKSVRERPGPRTTVLSVSQTGGDIRLTVVRSDYADLASDDGFIESVIDELHEKEVHPPWESGEGLAMNVEAYLGDGSEIPSEFYEDRYDWDELIEPHNEYWAKEFTDDVRKAVEKLLDDGDISLHGGDFPGESIGEVVVALATGGMLSVMPPAEVAAELAIWDDFRHYSEHGQEGVDEISGPIIDEIRETWKNRQLMRQDNKTFDVMRDALDAPIELLPNSDAVLRMLGAFKEKGWEAVSFRDMAKEFPGIAGQERFWKAIAKGSPKLTPDRLQTYLDGKNPKATEMLPKSFGGKAVNPPKYRMVAEDDYEGYTISNVDEHMLGVAALYVEDFNENAANPKQSQENQPHETKGLIVDAMGHWHVSAHPLSDSDSGIGWIRYDLIREEDGTSVMFIQEIQSDFMWAIEFAAAGGTPKLANGFPDSWDAASSTVVLKEQSELAGIDIGEGFVPSYIGGDPSNEKLNQYLREKYGGWDEWLEAFGTASDDFNKKLAQYILKKFQGWDHYLLGNLMTTARKNGVDKVVMNTSETIKLNPASAPRAIKKLKLYDELAKDFGFDQEQIEMYGHDKEFHSRAAGRMPYHRVHLLIATSR